MLLALLAALCAAVAFGLAALLQALAAREEPDAVGIDPRLLLHLLRRPPFVVALVLNLLGFALHLLALRSLPLFLAQAVVSSSVAVTAVASARVLNSPLGRPEAGAVVAVVAGLALLTATADEVGESATSGGARALLLLAVVALVGLGVAAGRLSGAVGASVLGLAAGLGFAVVAISARLLPDLAPQRLLTEPAAYALVAGGAVGFLLYSVALQRAGVLTATSATVVGQTVAPALVGLLLLGDRVRDRAAPLVVLGLVLAISGCAALARRDPTLVS